MMLKNHVSGVAVLSSKEGKHTGTLDVLDVASIVLMLNMANMLALAIGEGLVLLLLVFFVLYSFEKSPAGMSSQRRS